MNDTSAFEGLGFLALGVVPMLIGLAVGVAFLVVMWKIYTKAGKPGWACLVPIYNVWVLFEIAQGEGWKCLLSLIPVVGFIFPIINIFKLAAAFGKGAGFGVGLLLLPYIFLPILAFGNDTYYGPQY